MVSDDLEKIILGNWLIGDHIEDLDMFEPKHFTHSSIVRELKFGVHDPIELAKRSDTSIEELSKLQSYGQFEHMYEVGILNLQDKLAKEWLEEHETASPEEISENMKRFMKKTSELPSVETNLVSEVIDELNRRKEEKPIYTGLSDLDRMLCGIRKKELTAVGARPSVGKSAFIQQVAVKVAKQEKKVLFFPLEMSRNAIVQRMIMGHTDIPQSQMRNGLTKDMWSRSMRGFEIVDEFLEQGNFLIFERVNDLQTIKKLIEFHKPYMIVIDQLEQLKDGDMRWDGKRERFSHMTHEMQAISLDMDVAVWFACQINRSADNSVPTMANLKESGTIEEDSTNVILLHRLSEKTEMQNMQLELAKQKDGECGVVELMFDAPHFKFSGVIRG